MARFSSAREAKEHLIAAIVAEAAREGVPLSELERKMLYFSESGWTLPDMLEVNAAFEREYDTGAYEEKIGRLVRTLEARLQATDAAQYDAWVDAIVVLSDEDHYLLVLLNPGDAAAVGERAERPPGDFARLIATAVVIVALAFAIMIFFNWHG